MQSGVVLSAGVTFEYIFFVGSATNNVEKCQYYSGVQKGNRNLRENYRQISLTCILCKIAEKVVRNRVVDFWSDLNLLNPDQFAYLGGKLACAADETNLPV